MPSTVAPTLVPRALYSRKIAATRAAASASCFIASACFFAASAASLVFCSNTFIPAVTVGRLLSAAHFAKGLCSESVSRADSASVLASSTYCLTNPKTAPSCCHPVATLPIATA